MTKQEEVLAPSLAAALDALPAAEQSAAIKKLGQHQVERMAFFASHSAGQVVTLSAWLAASLLAINGAGLAYLVDHLEKVAAPVTPSAAFALGAGAALSSGYFVQWMQLKAMTPTEQLSLFWLGVSVVGHYDEEDEKRVRAPLARLGRLSWVSQFLGFASVMLFLAGAFSLGSQVKSAIDSPAKVLVPAPAK